MGIHYRRSVEKAHIKMNHDGYLHCQKAGLLAAR